MSESHPSNVASTLEQSLLAGLIESDDFERLRARMFANCPALKDEMCGGAATLNFSPVRQDALGDEYVLVLDTKRNKKSPRGFRAGYYIASKPTSLGAFRKFVEASDYDYPEDLLEEVAETIEPDESMACLSWIDAVAYCNWLTHESGTFFTLPFMEEWTFAGDCLIDKWPQTGLLDGFAEGNSKWLPPGLDSYGTMRAGDELHGPAETGMIWEWCMDRASIRGENRMLCAGVWPNKADGHDGVSLRSHAINFDKRISTAGLRPIMVPQEALWRTNRGLIGDEVDSSQLADYLKSALNFSDVPGSSARPDERPNMYHSLPANLQTRIDAFLSLLHQIDGLAEDAKTLSAPAPEYRADKNVDQVPGINSIRPMEEREFDAESSLAEAPRSTMFELDQNAIKEILDSKIAEEKGRTSGVKGLLGKLFGKD